MEHAIKTSPLHSCSFEQTSEDICHKIKVLILRDQTSLPFWGCSGFDRIKLKVAMQAGVGQQAPSSSRPHLTANFNSELAVAA